MQELSAPVTPAWFQVTPDREEFPYQGNANLFPISLFRAWDALSLGAGAFRDLHHF